MPGPLDPLITGHLKSSLLGYGKVWVSLNSRYFTAVANTFPKTPEMALLSQRASFVLYA